MALEMYEKQAVKTRKVQLNAAKWTACISGSFFSVMFGFNLWSNWVASYIIAEQWLNSEGEPYKIDELISVQQCCLMAIFTSGMLMPILPGIIKGLVAG